MSNFTKFGLGMISILFDVLFMLQHYVFYRNRYDIHDSDHSHSSQSALIITTAHQTGGEENFIGSFREFNDEKKPVDTTNSSNNNYVPSTNLFVCN